VSATHAGSGARPVDYAAYLLGVAGLAGCIALIWLGMRAVLGVGGFCAEGGPYVIETHCPPGVAVTMTLAFPGLFLFGGLMAWKGAALGAGYAAAVLLAWPALFISLGWNFLEFGFFPPGGQGGVALGWIIPGVLFELMGILPLWAALPARGRRGGSDAGRRRAASMLETRARRKPDAGDPNLTRLERLRASGLLTAAEYEAARRAALGGSDA
jgi:hypothetical protein